MNYLRDHVGDELVRGVHGSLEEVHNDSVEPLTESWEAAEGLLQWSSVYSVHTLQRRAWTYDLG